MRARRGSDGFQLVVIEWVDSHSGEGWQSLDVIKGRAEPAYCRSVGWLVSEENGTKVLVAHLSGERNENFRVYAKGELIIPNTAILRMRRVRI